MSLSSEKKRPTVVGPWGGPGGSRWDDGVYTGIKQVVVVVVHGAGILSVQFEYDQKGFSVWSEKHGGDGGTRIDKITLNYPVEYLTSVCGYYGSLSSSGSAIIVKSLTFESNLSKYGPFGYERGMYFSFPMSSSSGKIVGFHGRAGSYLDSIGFYLQNLGQYQSKALLSSQSTQELSKSSYSIVDDGIDHDLGRSSSDTYDIFLAVRGRGDNFAILSNSYTRGSATASLAAPEYNNTTSLNSGRSGYSMMPAGPLTYGPWGGSGGTIFDDGAYTTGIREIKLTRNAGITSIKVLYDRNGQAVWGNKNGGSGGIKTDKIVFDFPFEILTHVTGYFGTTMIMGPTAVKSLTFHTTKRDYGPYGDEEGTFFSSLLVEGKVVGFHGRSGWFIDSIGVHVLEGKVGSSTSRNKVGMPLLDYSSSRGIEEEVVSGIVIKEAGSSDPGPWGGNWGRPWDDGVYSGIKQVYITRGDVINSIQIEYDRGGQSVWSVRHGSTTGEISHRVKFDYPNEVLNCLSGYYCANSYDDSIKVVKSLTFHSTRGKYGPFGEQVGTYFTSNPTATVGKVVGFHGRSGLYLDAIGVHMQHWLGEKKPASKSMFSKYFF